MNHGDACDDSTLGPTTLVSRHSWTFTSVCGLSRSRSAGTASVLTRSEYRGTSRTPWVTQGVIACWDWTSGVEIPHMSYAICRSCASSCSPWRSEKSMPETFDELLLFCQLRTLPSGV